jgi:transposase
LENLCEQGFVDLFYGDESHVCSTGYVPYGWQFPGEEVFIPVEKGCKITIWGLISRRNHLHWRTTEKNINANFIFTQLEEISFSIRKPTVIIVDNASIHRAHLIQQQLPFWEQRGLYVFYLPAYSPHLNIAETLWRKLKKEQLDPRDYFNKDTLFYAVNRCLGQVGNLWKIQFSSFNIN